MAVHAVEAPLTDPQSQHFSSCSSALGRAASTCVSSVSQTQPECRREMPAASLLAKWQSVHLAVCFGHYAEDDLIVLVCGGHKCIHIYNPAYYYQEMVHLQVQLIKHARVVSIKKTDAINLQFLDFQKLLDKYEKIWRLQQ
jgi:hypothetical protein